MRTRTTRVTIEIDVTYQYRNLAELQKAMLQTALIVSRATAGIENLAQVKTAELVTETIDEAVGLKTVTETIGPEATADEEEEANGDSDEA